MRRFLLGAALVAAACGNPPSTGTTTPGPRADATPSYRATVRWTSHGVPHVRADDAGGLGFGQGYAMARAHVCVMADQYVRVRGERARWFGAGAGDAHVDSDFANLHLGWRKRAQAMLPQLSPEPRALLEGFAAGYGEYLARTPARQRPAPCRDAAWVQPVEPADVLAVVLSTATLASSRFVEREIATAAPGVRTGALRPLPDRRHAVAAASNAWGIGAERTASGGGIVVANPHFPWEGDLVFFEAHLTSDDLDVYGGTLVGIPGIQIGMTARHAWSHTFSASTHMAIYRLELDAASALRYRHGDETLAIVPTTYTIDVLTDGKLARTKRTLYRSAVGPMVVTSLTPWDGPGGYAFTVRDVAIAGAAQLDQPFAMARATSRAEFERALALSGTPFVNTVYADAAGDALYVDGSRVPALSERALGAWMLGRKIVPAVEQAWRRGVLVLDGSNPIFDLEDYDPRAPGAIPIAQAPRVARRDFVMNANDSYRFTNLAAPETAVELSPLWGDDAARPTPRTLENLALLAGDHRFTLDEAAAAMLSNRSFTAARLRAEVVAACAPKKARECATLAAWDGRFAPDSRGAVLWREVMAELAVDGAVPWKLAFDRQAPASTPAGVARPSADVAAAITRAGKRLRDAGLAVDEPLASRQRAPRGDVMLPVPGGDDLDGVANVVGHRHFNFSLLPATPPGLVNYGSSFILAAELTAAGPRARALLTYGNTSDPASPVYRDQLELFARGELRPVRFTEADITADPALVIEEIQSR
jgi:acyl-homoserine-lactone acylase